MTLELRILTTDREVRAFCERLVDEPRVAIDTEFHGEHVYSPRLMLVQLATSAEVAILDPLAEGLRPHHLTMILETISSHGAQLIGHSLGCDVEVLHRVGGVLPTRLFDTQIAAAFVNAGGQVGLARLLSSKLGVRLEKRFTLADWSRRPLPPEQLEYAAEDVRYLLPLATKLQDSLRQKDRLAWVEEECERLLDPVFLAPQDPETALKTVRGRAKVGSVDEHIQKVLAAERERIAQERNQPRRTVLPDDLLVDLSRRLPKDASEIAGDTNRRTSSGLRKHADRWLAALRRAETTVPTHRPRAQRPLTPAQDGLLTLMRKLIASRAREAGLAPSLLLSPLKLVLPQVPRKPLGDRAELDALLGLTGWRAQVLGDSLWALLSGELAATIMPMDGGLGLGWSRTDDPLP